MRSLPTTLAVSSEDILVGILLCTFNGGRFLGHQLESITRQRHSNWRLLISDDGSTDDTLIIAKEFEKRHPHQVTIVEGERKGLAQNFLTAASRPPFVAQFWAFCDQDDIWGDDKLSRAVEALSKTPPEVPALYCSRTALIDSSGGSQGLSPLFDISPGFRNALVQNLASGNTMVFNEAARQLLVMANVVGVPFHDWLLYLVVTGCGGNVFYDGYPTVRYRQHYGNVVGYWGGRKGILD